MSFEADDIERTRRWLKDHCHRAEIRHTLTRAVEYIEAIERAGLSPDCTCGDDLYEFLIDPAAAATRARTFLAPTL